MRRGKSPDGRWGGAVPGGREGREGVALLVALLFIVLLSALVVEFCYETSVDASIVESGDTEFDAYVAARSAVAMGMSLLAADLNESAGSGAGGAGQGSSGASQVDSEQDVWFTRRADAPLAYQEINDGVMSWDVADESGKLNVNALIVRRGGEGQGDQEANQNVFMAEALRVFFEARASALGVEGDPVDAILDWIDGPDSGDPDDAPQRSGNGAESDYYGSLETPYGCKNAPLSSIEELLLVRGVSPALYFGDPDVKDSRSGEAMLPLSEYLTVHGDSRGRVNINTARLEVLDAMAEAARRLGAPGAVPSPEAILTLRERQPFQGVSDITSQNMMIVAPGAAGADVDGDVARGRGVEAGGQTAQGTKMFVAASKTFRIQGDGYAGNTQVRIEAFVRRNSGEAQEAGGRSRGVSIQGVQQEQVFRILDWRVIR